jgi:hypothetical protein
MAGVFIEIKDDDTGLEWYVPLENRITLLRGDSGYGKTEMVRILLETPDGVEINTSLPYVVVTAQTWQSVLTTTQNSIIIFDDLREVETCEFAELLSKTEESRNYILVIGRENIGDTISKMLSYSIDSILRFVVDNTGKKHYTEQYFKLSQYRNDKVAPNYILVEDSKGGYEYFKALFGDCVIHAENGKSSICEDTLKLVENNSDSNVLVLADTAGFGCHMSQFYNNVMRSFPNVIIDGKYESFEYVLLNTNYFKNNKEVQLCLSGNDIGATNYYSKEIYYEKVLERVTLGTRLKYVHGNAKFRECWYMDCNTLNNDLCNEHIKKICEYYVDTSNKHEYMLENTKFGYFLEIKEALT